MSVREDIIEDLRDAIGKDSTLHGVLLTASRPTIISRLQSRELGSGLQAHLRRSETAARQLDDSTPPWVHRVDTTGRNVTDIADAILHQFGWMP